MTQISAKQIKTADIHALYDVMLADVSSDTSQLPADTTPEVHVQQMMYHNLTKLGYPLADNLDRILKSYEAKLGRDGGQRHTADTSSDMAAAIFQHIQGKPLQRSGAAAPAKPAPAAAPASSNSAPAPAAAPAPQSEPVQEIELAMNTNFTIADESAPMIDTTLNSLTGGAVTSFAALIAAMSLAEDTAADADKANASVKTVVDQYTGGQEDVDETAIIEMPDYQASGFAELSTDNPMIAVLNTLIAQGVTPEITYEEAITRISKAETGIAEARMTQKALQRDLRRARPRDLRPVDAPQAETLANNDDEIRDLNAHVQVSEAPAADIFTNAYGASAQILGFDIPVLEFDTAHPNVPKVDPTFRFFAPVLVEALHSIAENEIIWLHGDSGCGKSEFWSQVAARLNMPFTRMNLDSHLTRSDIIGINRMLPTSNGSAEMRFVEGILPRAMSQPGILMLDEFDLGDPEIMPIFQPVLEGNPLVLLEDGGRVVHPHPMFRIAITGNTIGLGSSNQMYNNAFEQSAATRDRISAYVPMPYMTPDIEKEVVMARVPQADEGFVEKLIQLANKVRDGYKAGEIHQIFSTRAVLSCSKRFARFAPHYPTEEDAAFGILESVILGRMDDASHNVVKGLIDNIFALE